VITMQLEMMEPRLCQIVCLGVRTMDGVEVCRPSVQDIAKEVLKKTILAEISTTTYSICCNFRKCK
jgi:hypothetical protein